MRLNTARTLTNSSPVASIKDLVFWFEPTLEESFLSSQAEDQLQISQWNDINPQSIKKYFALKTASAHVTYEDNAINSLPGVRFNGANSANGYLTLSSTSSTSDFTNIQTTTNRFTAFIVMKLDSTSDATTRGIFYNGNASTSGWEIYKDSTNARGFLFGGVVATLSTSA